MGEAAKEFSPTKTERRAILGILEAQARLQAEAEEIANETKARLGLPADVRIDYDALRDKLVIVEKPAAPAPPPKA